MTTTKRHPLWGIWCQMKNRCYLTSSKSYGTYGGRGITVCARWRYSFQAFVDDMGPRPSLDHSIDRIDNNGNYEPANCRWATREQQNANRRGLLRLTCDGETRTLTEWAKLLGVDKRVIWSRIKLLGWSDERAIKTPFRVLKA